VKESDQLGSSFDIALTGAPAKALEPLRSYYSAFHSVSRIRQARWTKIFSPDQN
jgi:hypothetical protein